MAVIKVLDEILANKIAAGEVVERCSSVVKELVENSIDAGSTEIKVELLESGTKEIKVIDNGKGMAEYICRQLLLSTPTDMSLHVLFVLQSVPI